MSKFDTWALTISYSVNEELKSVSFFKLTTDEVSGGCFVDARGIVDHQSFNF